MGTSEMDYTAVDTVNATEETVYAKCYNCIAPILLFATKLVLFHHTREACFYGNSFARTILFAICETICFLCGLVVLIAFVITGPIWIAIGLPIIVCCGCAAAIRYCIEEVDEFNKTGETTF